MADIQTLLDIMARLRDPEGGCPWDLQQDFASISPHTIEEAYEVDEAIARGDLESLRDELGDLLFQVVFQARLAEELGAFEFSGVVEAIVDKLVRRHPHVFAGAETPATAEAQRTSWEAIKRAERAAAGGSDSRAPDPFEGVPRNLPALARSAKIDGRLERETGRRGPGAGESEAGREHDALRAAERESLILLIGEGIRDWVRLARRLGIDPEQALRRVDDERMAEVRGQRSSGGRSDSS